MKRGVLRGIAFDFDGVILESVRAKSDAFRSLFASHPDKVEAIVALHEAHGGLSRFHKFEIIHRDILNLPYGPQDAHRLGEAFNRLVYRQVLNCPMVAGAWMALNRWSRRVPLFVVSGTPEGELRQIVVRRNLGRFFSAVYGSPRGKVEILSTILEHTGWPPKALAMVGDATTDWEAATQLALPFVGRVPPGTDSPFPPRTLLLPDMNGLDRALARAIMGYSRP